jgi:hypothetical protein
MRELIELIDKMLRAKVVQNYAVFVRVVRADYLAVMALKVGRAKDRLRVLALIESNAVQPAEIGKLAQQYQLEEQWLKFREQILDAD